MLCRGVACRRIVDLTGLALAYAINSGKVFAGTDGIQSMTLGVRIIPATGAISRMKLKTELVVEGRTGRISRVHQEERMPSAEHARRPQWRYCW